MAIVASASERSNSSPWFLESHLRRQFRNQPEHSLTVPGTHAPGTAGVWKFINNQTSMRTNPSCKNLWCRYSHASRTWARWSSTRELVNQAWAPNWASSRSLTQMLMAKREVSLKFHRPERLWLYGNLEGSKPQKWSNPSAVGTGWGREYPTVMGRWLVMAFLTASRTSWHSSYPDWAQLTTVSPRMTPPYSQGGERKQLRSVTSELRELEAEDRSGCRH